MRTIKDHRMPTALELHLLSNKQKTDLVISAWHLEQFAQNPLSLRKLVYRYKAPYTTCRDRIFGGAVSKVEANQSKQRLTPGEEAAMVKEIMQLEGWGFPLLIPMLMKMAQDLCDKKGDTMKLNSHWYITFLKRHPHLRARFIPPLDKDRVAAEDPSVFTGYFEMFKAQMAKYKIHPDDVYNMDEKGCMMGFIGQSKAIVSRKSKNAYMKQPGNREWVSLIECICSTGHVLKGWVIFKGKYQRREWFEAWPDGFICTSEKGWTDDELCFQWLKLCFEPESKRTQKGEYRMLLFDGHGSHVTKEVIQFCDEHKIVLLCLPSHSTHLLQPLDVGVFAPLAAAYKNGVLIQTRMVDYQLDKVDFLRIYSHARTKAITPKNVKSAWQKTGLFPYEPKVVLSQIQRFKVAKLSQQAQKLPSNESMLPPPLPPPRILRSDDAIIPERPVTRGCPAPLVIETPQDIAAVNTLTKQLIDEIRGQRDFQVAAIAKLSKAAALGLTESHLTRATNSEIMEAQYRVTKKKGKFAGQRAGTARVLDLSMVIAAEQAKKEAEDAKKKEAFQRKVAKEEAKRQKEANATAERLQKTINAAMEKADRQESDAQKKALAKEQAAKRKAEKMAATVERNRMKAIAKKEQQTLKAAEKARVAKLLTPKAPKKAALLESPLDLPWEDMSLSPQSPTQHFFNPFTTLSRIKTPLTSNKNTSKGSKQFYLRMKQNKACDVVKIPLTITRSGRIIRKKVIFE